MSSDLRLIAVSLFLWGMGESTYLLFQPLYLQELGASPLAIGTILGSAGIFMALSHIPAGILADRIGRREVMWAAWILGVSSGLIMALARSLEIFTLGIILYGVTSFVIAPLNSYITAARNRWTTAQAISFVSGMYNLGAIIGPVLGGWIGDLWGFPKIYLTASLIFISSTIIIFFITAQPTERESNILSSPKSLINGWFIGFLGIIFLANLAMYIAQPLAANYLQNIHNLSLRQIGFLGAVNSFGASILTLGIGRIGAGPGFILAQGLTILFPLLLWRGTNMTYFSIGYFMLGGFRSAKSMSIAQVRELISSVNMGLAYGISETVGGTAVILAPIIAGYLFEQNISTMFQLAILLSIIAITATSIFTLKHRSFERITNE